jgi:hypothetical protein
MKIENVEPAFLLTEIKSDGFDAGKRGVSLAVRVVGYQANEMVPKDECRVHH